MRAGRLRSYMKIRPCPCAISRCGAAAWSFLLPREARTITLTDFITPDLLPITGRLFVSAQEGDAVLEGDRMLFGRDAASLAPISGPNNPEDNFFASQINDQNGVLDTSGTFGTRNANAAAGTNTSGLPTGLGYHGDRRLRPAFP